MIEYGPGGLFSFLGSARGLVGAKLTELVTYVLQPGGVEVQQWAAAVYLDIGEEVELPVVIKLFQRRQGWRYTLEIPSADGNF
jgi:hypothetical protein